VAVKVSKLSISLERELGEHVYAAAEAEGLSVSAWLARAAAAELRRKALGEYLADWQRKHGKLTAAELEQARSDLGYPARRR
jgi:hypothetical protein